MATKQVTICDICGKEMIGTQHDLRIQKTYKWYQLPDMISCNWKEWYEIDICDTCSKEMINYIKERRCK